ncbi:hypothetical protein JW898_01625 [Candidatus Woesearchaeota archaeon]|nr:hypothetical protein [Candidatus Woesearchaeota archaeon]
MDEKLTLEQLFEGRLYVNIWDKEKEEIEGVMTESDLRTFARCPYAYFLKKHASMTRTPISAFAAMALMFQQSRKSLFNLKDENTGRLFPYQHRAGTGWKLAEEMTAEELRRYLAIPDPKKFGKALKGKWGYFVSNNRYANRDIAWSYEKQRFAAALHLAKAAKHYHNFVVDNGAPVLGFINDMETIRFEGNMFNVRFPEIRRGMTIDDPTLWGFNAADDFEKPRSINESSLVTLRILAYCTLAHDMDIFRMKWGVPDELAERWDGKTLHLGPEVSYRHLNAIADETTETRRSEEDLDRFRRAVEHFQQEVSRERFYPNPKSCGSCQYNAIDLLGEAVCRKRKKGAAAPVPAHFFEDDARKTSAHISRDSIRLVGGIEREGKDRHNVAEYEVTFREEEGTLHARGNYDCSARGIGMEQLMIRRMDEELQKATNQTRMPVSHDIGWEHNFEFAGQKKIAELLTELGYVDGKKNYSPNDD